MPQAVTVEALFLPAKLSQLGFQDVIDGLGADVETRLPAGE